MDKREFYRDARGDRAGPLDGVRVLELSKVWSGPMAGCLLADLGADVVRVEMPGNREGRMPPEIPGTGRSWFRESVHRNKRSVSLDLRKPESAAVFLDLVAGVDVVLENYKPGTLDRWGIGYAACAARRPGIVFVSISGWGQFGPMADAPGYDPIAQAVSGWMALNGSADGPPVKAPTFLADDLAGLHAAIGTLAALRHRDVTGEGQHVDVSLLDSLLYNSGGYLTLGATDTPIRRWGAEAEFVVPAGTYACADGHLYLAIALDKHWRVLADLIGRPDLARADGFATNEARRANRTAVNDVVAAWCATRPVADAVAALAGEGLAAAPVRRFADAAADPHVIERDMVQETVLCNGTTAPLTGPSIKFSRTPTRVRTGAPEPGADTDDVLRAAGLDTDRIEELRALRAI
ncbi:CaiB/BaiF CoA transferase family protein [Actinokineospora enzanensis]|uniref:CaiB/BaiF CoA transferase family protein n=1 Tax=Actinokineospora enzanensis TaxID=155975 RepID=UPI00036597D6|nr:CoA transferase [Actinokineospora enzanensis]